MRARFDSRLYRRRLPVPSPGLRRPVTILSPCHRHRRCHANARMMPSPLMAQAKDRTTAALLCFFLGGVGAHRFYVGKSRAALVRAALMAGGFMLSSSRAAGSIGDFAAVAALSGAVWVIVDLINIVRGRFTDASGNSLGKAAPPGAESAGHDIAASRRTEQSVLLAVKSLGGLVGPTELALRTGLTIDEAKDHLESLVERGHAQLHLLPSVERNLAAAQLLVDTRGIGAITGKPGTGKSCLLRLLEHRLPAGLYRTFYLCHSPASRLRRVLHPPVGPVRPAAQLSPRRHVP